VQRYEAILSNGTRFVLYEESYFNDKRVFFEHHRSNLLAFYEALGKSGLPVLITDLRDRITWTLENVALLHAWLKEHQGHCESGYIETLSSREKLLGYAENCISGIEAFLREEVSQIASAGLNPWNVVGNYKNLAFIVRPTCASLERLRSSLDVLLVDSIMHCIRTPYESIDGLSDLLAYSNSPHDQLTSDGLLRRVRGTLAEIGRRRMAI
jgi:hypothetical protein